MCTLSHTYAHSTDSLPPFRFRFLFRSHTKTHLAPTRAHTRKDIESENSTPKLFLYLLRSYSLSLALSRTLSLSIYIYMTKTLSFTQRHSHGHTRKQKHISPLQLFMRVDAKFHSWTLRETHTLTGTSMAMGAVWGCGLGSCVYIESVWEAAIGVMTRWQ
jgi:hypothetical protein